MIIEGRKKLAKELGASDRSISRWVNSGLPRKISQDEYRTTYLYDLDVVKQWIKDNNRLLKNTKAKLPY